MPSRSSRARMKLSIGLRAQARLRTAGGGGPLDLLERPVRTRVPVHSTPWSIHARRRPISSAVRWAPIGGMNFWSRPATRRIRRLSALLPGRMSTPGLAALERGVLLIEAQAAHLLLRAVADHAAFGEQRLDIAGEFDLDFGGGRQRDVGSPKRHARDQAGERATQHPHSEHRTYYIPAGRSQEGSKLVRRTGVAMLKYGLHSPGGGSLGGN